MKTHVVGMAIAVLCSAGAVFADQPPSWSEFNVRSPNGHYLAEVRVKDKRADTSLTEQTYVLTVFDARQGIRRHSLWSCEYEYDGYSDGLLSDDGSTFVYVNFWYAQDGPVVSIYRHGKKSGIVLGREFNIRARSTVSHQAWLDDSVSPNVRFVQAGTRPLALEITTLDHKTHLIDVESGKFVKP